MISNQTTPHPLLLIQPKEGTQIYIIWFKDIILFGAMEVISTTLYPRVFPLRLQQGQPVTIVGQVVSLDQTQRKLVIRPDVQSQNIVEVSLPESMECAELRNIKFIEVRGTGQSQREISLKQYCNFKENFDLKTYNEVLRLTTDSNFRHMFSKR